MAYRVLMMVELLEVTYPHVTPAGSRFHDRPFSDVVGDISRDRRDAAEADEAVGGAQLTGITAQPTQSKRTTR